MKILFLHRWTGVRAGGTETHIKGLIKYFLKRNEVTLITRGGGKVDELKKNFSKLKIFTISKNLLENDDSYEKLFLLYIHTGFYIIKLLIRVVYLLLSKKVKSDVISVHFITEAIVANIIRKLFGIPYIFILEGYTDWEAKEAKKANACISISTFISNQCQRKYNFYPQVLKIGEDKFPPIKKDELREKMKTKVKNILTLCRLEPRKNLNALIETARIIKKYKRKDVMFYLGGRGISQNEILEKIKKYKLKKYLNYLGFVKENDLVKVYRNSYIYFLPTREEGFGIVYLEAMKSGCPVVSTDVSAIPEAVGYAGILIKNPYDYQKYTDAILKLVDNKDLWLKKALYGLKRSKTYDWNKIILEYEKVYKRVVK